MRVLLQRVDHASVSVDGITKGKIKKGLMLLFGVESNPKLDQLDWLCQKVLNLRVFKDQNEYIIGIEVTNIRKTYLSTRRKN